MTLFKQAILKVGLASAALLTAMSAHAVTVAKTDNTTVKIGGYVKLDAMFTDWSDGTVAGSSIGRDFYVPSVTPVGGTSENTVFDMHAQQTRINFGTETKMGEHTLKSFIEIDFMLPPGGDERISNSYNPRMRHAFLSYDNWLFGQTWTTFMNVGALPESVDFIGNTDGTIFVRQPQIRYTRGPWQFSLENPETTVTDGGRVITDDNEWPDLVGRYNYKSKNLTLVGAVLLRQLTYNTTGTGGTVDDSEAGYGLSLTGKYIFGNKDDIRFGINGGSGMGRYIALNVANGAILDANNKLEAIDSVGYFGSWRHLWNQKWRSNFIYSRIDIDNNTAISAGATTKTTQSGRANLMYSLAKNMTLGGELALANRKQEDGLDGDMTRLQFMAMYKF